MAETSVIRPVRRSREEWLKIALAAVNGGTGDATMHGYFSFHAGMRIEVICSSGEAPPPVGSCRRAIE